MRIRRCATSRSASRTRALAGSRSRRDGGLNAEVVNAPAYDVDLNPADAVVSFSVLEHVYDRPAYLAAVARHLAPEGRAFVNYDLGSLRRARRLRDRAKNLIGSAAARPRPGAVESIVRAGGGFHQLAGEAGLEVEEAKSFNSDLKVLYRLVPENARDEFTERWLEFELAANELLPPYADEHAPYLMTRNFILRRG